MALKFPLALHPFHFMGERTVFGLAVRRLEKSQFRLPSLKLMEKEDLFSNSPLSHSRHKDLTWEHRAPARYLEESRQDVGVPIRKNPLRWCPACQAVFSSIPIPTATPTQNFELTVNRRHLLSSNIAPLPICQRL